MDVVGTVESLWRYPVKSMRGEDLPEVFLGYAGVHGDRVFAIRNSAAPAGFPFLTGRERHDMIVYRPHFRHPDKAAAPANWAEAQRIAPGLTPAADLPDNLALDVETPSGETLAVDDPALLRSLKGPAGEGALTLSRSDRAQTDCRPVSLFSLQTALQIGREVGRAVDKRRFRANIYLDLSPAGGFAEDAFVGRKLQIGPRVVVSVLERDPRCKMITLDPDTAKADPEILFNVVRRHEGKAGIYAAVLAEGKVRKGDAIGLLS